MQSYDIVVGIPSYNNAKTIGHVVKATANGLHRYFPKQSVLITNSDGGSTDQTVDRFFKSKIPSSIRRESLRYAVIAGKGAALLHVFEQAQLYKAKVCIMVDADLRSITPNWMKALAGPIFDQSYDFIAPMYARHKFDGTITKNLAYPVTTALYGKYLRQPIGGDFGLSGKLVRRVLEKNIWENDILQYGVDIFLSTTAIAEGMIVGQAHLGAKIHDPKDPRGLGPMFRQVCATLFELTCEYSDIWAKVKKYEPVHTFGKGQLKKFEPVTVDRDALLSEYRRGVRKHRFFIERAFPGHKDILHKLIKANPDNFTFSADFWSGILYRSIVFYNRRMIDRKDLFDLLTHFYYGRVASYIREVKDSENDSTEEVIDGIVKAFIDNKPELIKLWKNPPNLKS